MSDYLSSLNAFYDHLSVDLTERSSRLAWVSAAPMASVTHRNWSWQGIPVKDDENCDVIHGKQAKNLRVEE